MTVFEYAGLTWKVDYGIDFVDNGKQVYADYEEIIQRLHQDIEWVWEHEPDYQGDFYGLGVDGDGYYCFVSGSFGSCSGCDWLQAISDVDGAKEFLRHYEKVVIRKQEKYEMKKYLEAELLNSYWKKGIEGLLSKLDSLHRKETGETEK